MITLWVYGNTIQVGIMHIIWFVVSLTTSHQIISISELYNYNALVNAAEKRMPSRRWLMNLIINKLLLLLLMPCPLRLCWFCRQDNCMFTFIFMLCDCMMHILLHLLPLIWCDMWSLHFWLNKESQNSRFFGLINLLLYNTYMGVAVSTNVGFGLIFPLDFQFNRFSSSA